VTKKELDRTIFKFIVDSRRPVSTREISEKLKIAWHTADRYCLKLQLKGKVACFTIGKSTAWHLAPGGSKK
jgi:predicted transcriptional regulator